MHIKDPVVSVGVWWITEAQKDPACTKKWLNNQPVDCDHYGRRRRRRKLLNASYTYSNTEQNIHFTNAH